MRTGAVHLGSTSIHTVVFDGSDSVGFRVMHERRLMISAGDVAERLARLGRG